MRAALFCISLLVSNAASAEDIALPIVPYSHHYRDIWNLFLNHPDHHVITIHYEKGEAGLDTLDKLKIDITVAGARFQGARPSAIIAAWSDFEHSFLGPTTVSGKDIELAGLRSANIRTELEQIGLKSIWTLNMESKPDWLIGMMDVLTSREDGIDIRNPQLMNHIRIWSALKRLGGASRAVVILSPKDSRLMSVK